MQAGSRVRVVRGDMAGALGVVLDRHADCAAVDVSADRPEFAGCAFVFWVDDLEVVR